MERQVKCLSEGSVLHAGAKTLRQECAWNVQREAKRLTWLEWSGDIILDEVKKLAGRKIF